MRFRSRIRIAVVLGAVVVPTLVVAVYLSRHTFLERWYLNRLDSPSAEDLANALVQLATCGSDRCVPALIEGVGSKSLEAEEAARTLGAFGEAATPQLIEALLDERREVRSLAVESLIVNGSSVFDGIEDDARLFVAVSPRSERRTSTPGGSARRSPSPPPWRISSPERSRIAIRIAWERSSTLFESWVPTQPRFGRRSSASSSLPTAGDGLSMPLSLSALRALPSSGPCSKI